MQQIIRLVPGQNSGPTALGFRAYTAVVDNPTAQWWYCREANRIVQPYITGLRISLPGDEAITFVAQTPAGFTSSVIAGEQGTAIISDLMSPDIAGISTTLRPQYYDRTPVSASVCWNVDFITPHGSTQRFASTIPTGQLGAIEAVQMSIHRAVAAPAANYTYLNFSHIPLLGTTTIYRAWVYAPAQGTRHDVIMGQFGFLNSGDQLVGVSEDDCSGGNVDYHFNVKAITFSK